MECYRFYLSNAVVYEAVVQGMACGSTITSATGQPITATQESKALKVTSLTFQYYNAANQGGALLSVPLNSTDLYLVRRIDVATTVQGVSSVTPFTVETQAVVRAGR